MRVSAGILAATAGSILYMGSATAADRTVPHRVLPYMVVTVGDTTVASGTPVGGYTRLRMKFTPAASPSDRRIYDDERRNGILRWLAGKAITRVLTLKVSVAQPKLTTVTMAASVNRESNSRAGESWTTEVNSDRVMTPYFRIDPESAVGIESSFVLSSTYDAAISKAIVDIVRRGAQLVAPATTLVTSLNEDRFDQAADFVDNSIANLLKEYIVERATNDFPLKERAGGSLMTVKLTVPMGNEVTPASGARPKLRPVEIGIWEIVSDEPIMSVFENLKWAPPPAARGKREGGSGCSESPAVCKAFGSLDPQTILNFAVAENVPVAQALAGEQAIGGARDALIREQTDAEQSAAAARSLCALVADKAHRLGFNRFDVAAITWAYASQSNLGGSGRALRDPANCTTLSIAYSLGLTRAEFTNDQDDPTT